MGLFKKEVSQVDYVETEHGPIYNFFYSFWTHIRTLMGANVLVIVFNIPMMFLAYAFSLFILPVMNSTFNVNNFVKLLVENGVVGNATLGNDIHGEDAAVQMYFLLIVFCVMFLITSCLFCIGPFQAGFSQIYRNLRRQNGVFFFDDLKEGIKTNLKQSLIVMFIGMIVTALDLFAAAFYLNIQNKIGPFIAAFFIAFFFVFMLVQNMVYQLMVSRDLSIKNLYRNAFLFFLLKFGPCFLILGIMVLFLMVIPFVLLLSTSYLTLGIYVFFYAFLVVTFIQYLVAFFTGELINEYMPAPKTEDDEYSEESDEDFESEEEDSEES